MLNPARGDSFRNVTLISDRAALAPPSRAALTDKKCGYLIEPYSNCAADL
jgi:hypothetical protein